ncbi:PIN domain protein [Pirellulimonas nuda]|uniref:PIN domain protein n=2 Tax=Pirellulimonas nuda TaxID=2528009 RepID=A0A518DJV0_9BACT|nr:PIN domain protein [Pirellulimonas nuda]
MEGLTELFRELETVLVDTNVAEVFGDLRARQFDAGRLTPLTDLWIASTAIAHDLTLVTHNTKDFEGIPGLSLADWLTP